MEDGFMNYKSIRMYQMKEKDCLTDRTIWIDESIDSDTEFMFIKMIDKILKMDKDKNIKPENALPINIRISSYGGDSTACFSIVETIKRLKRQSYKVYGYAYGKCMSSAFKIFISCTKRFAQPKCDLMCHMPNHAEYGGYYTMEDDRRKYEGIKRMWIQARSIILEFTNITSEMLDKCIGENDALYFWADESIEQNLGIVDELF